VSVNWRSPDLADALSRVNIGAHGLEHAQPDVVEHLAQRARLAEVAADAAAMAAASMVVGTFHTPVVPLERRTLEPAGEALATLDALCDWYSERPRDAAGVATGPQGREWTLVGVHVESWQGWLEWLVGVASVVESYADSYDRQTERRDLKPYGRPAYVPWTAPTQASAWTSGVLRGQDLGFRQARELLVAHGRENDAGGWVLLSVGADDRGRLPKFPGRRLADGVQVLADGAVVPVYAARPGGWEAVMAGFPDTAPEAVAPGWFARELGAR
jgi:hypothetical protein